MTAPVLRRAARASLLIALIAGCADSDERLLELSRASLARQSEQNAQMARQTQEIADASSTLVAADAQARQELIQLQQHLQVSAQAERASLDRQFEQLENERRRIAIERLRDPLIAAAILNTGTLLACLAPLLLAWWILRSSWAAQTDCAVAELLIAELVAEEPALLPQPRSALVHEGVPTNRAQ